MPAMPVLREAVVLAQLLARQQVLHGRVQIALLAEDVAHPDMHDLPPLGARASPVRSPAAAPARRCASHREDDPGRCGCPPGRSRHRWRQRGCRPAARGPCPRHRSGAPSRGPRSPRTLVPGARPPHRGEDRRPPVRGQAPVERVGRWPGHRPGTGQAPPGRSAIVAGRDRNSSLVHDDHPSGWPGSVGRRPPASSHSSASCRRPSAFSNSPLDSNAQA